MENQVSKARLIGVSRDPEVLRVVWAAAESNLWQLVISSDAWDAMEKLQSDLVVDVLLIDLPVRDAGGFRCLRWLRQLRPALPILLIDRTQQAGAKLHSMRVDSDDYLVAPLAVAQLEVAIQRSLSATRDGSVTEAATNGFERPENGVFFIGASPKLHRVSAQVVSFAEADLPVVISGEPGSGKEMVALLLHQLSARSGSAFTKVDCATLSTELLEREIFGWEPTSGAGVARTANGKLELSGGGTLFLNQIEEMPSQLQSRLASVIESGQLIRPGRPEPVKIDIWVIAASSLPMDRAISENTVIPELLRQFGTREVRVPPLRERKEELPLLARYYMHQLSRELGLAPKEFPAATEEAWQSYQWPGNLRELKKVVKQYLLEGETALEEKKVAPDQPSASVQTPQPETSETNPPVAPASRPVSDIGCYKSLRSMLRSVKEEAERAAILAALEKTGWNRKAAARLLKVSYRSILYKIEEYQMNLRDRSTSWASGQIPHGAQSNGRGDQKRAMDIILEGVARSTS